MNDVVLTISLFITDVKAVEKCEKVVDGEMQGKKRRKRKLILNDGKC